MATSSPDPLWYRVFHVGWVFHRLAVSAAQMIWLPILERVGAALYQRSLARSKRL